MAPNELAQSEQLSTRLFGGGPFENETHLN